MVLDWYSATIKAFQALWQDFIQFLPVLLGAIILFVIGWFIAVGVGKLIAEILKRLKFNKIFDRGDWKNALEKAEIKVDPSGFIGAIAKWILIIVFLQISVGILGWTDFAVLLGKVIAYLPNVVVAALIFVVAAIVADIIQKVVVVAAESARFTYTRAAGAIVKWAIWLFAILAILRQLLIVPALVDTLFSALVYGVVGIFIIAFGLGGKEAAGEILQDLRKKLKE
ncbi:MAG: hypothetical protein FJZ05_00585 [Candidatus Nealsonbacteria bacterium]|nr:hypothetical protein [Candidatus Nealsonbacteria bacterium]